MGSQFLVERPTVTAAVGHVRDVHQQIDGQLSRLRGQLASVLSDPAVWRGDAQVSFTGVHERVDGAIRRINTALDDIGTRLQTSEQLYGTSDSDGSTVIANAGGGV